MLVREERPVNWLGRAKCPTHSLQLLPWIVVYLDHVVVWLVGNVGRQSTLHGVRKQNAPVPVSWRHQIMLRLNRMKQLREYASDAEHVDLLIILLFLEKELRWPVVAGNDPSRQASFALPCLFLVLREAVRDHDSAYFFCHVGLWVASIHNLLDLLIVVVTTWVCVIGIFIV